MSRHDDPTHEEGSDAARDPHLQQALRHAPDAQVQAPAALGELILREARAKARTGTSTHEPQAAPRWAQRTWDWLARPAVATGFAGVMAATLVGLMWWDQPMDEALPRSPVPAAAPAAQRAAPPPPVASVPGLASGATPAVPAPAPEPARTRPAAPKPAVTREEAVPTPPPAREPAREAERATQDMATMKSTPAPAAAPAVTPPAVPTPAVRSPASPAPAAAAAPPTTAADSAFAEPPAEVEAQQRQRSAAPAETLSRRAAAKAQLNESRLQHEGEAFTRVASVRAAIASEPLRWAWERDGDAQPMNDVVQTWLAQLDADAGGRWQPVDATVLRPGREIRLLQDDQLRHAFRFVEGGILWWRPQGRWQQVTLPPAKLRALETNAP
jgi:hypothetical protein